MTKTQKEIEAKTADPLGSSAAPCYAISFDLKHPNTMVVATNKAELAYIEKWCDMHDILPPWMGDRDRLPIALSPNGGGWTDHMDRALYYVRFRDFIALVA